MSAGQSLLNATTFPTNHRTSRVTKQDQAAVIGKRTRSACSYRQGRSAAHSTRPPAASMPQRSSTAEPHGQSGTSPQEGNQQSSGVQIKLPLDSARVRYVAVLAPVPHYVRCRRSRVVSTLCSGG